MYRIRAVIIAGALLTFVPFARSVAKEELRLPSSPEELELSIAVDEALEEGPLKCTVKLKNLSKDTLRYFGWSDGDGGWCRIDSDRK